jgi:hypothetical protein
MYVSITNIMLCCLCVATLATHYHVAPYIAYLVFRKSVQINMDLTVLNMNGTLIFSNVLIFNT